MGEVTTKHEQTALSMAAQEPVPAVVSDSASLMAVIARAAADPNVDVSKMEKLLDMQERISARQAEQAFNSAMTAAQREMRPVAADCNNPQTKSKYASYYALDKALRPIYTKHGFSPSYDTDISPKPDHIRVLCYLSHEGGHSRTYKIDMPADGKGAKGGDVMTKTHATGAGYSYGQRYLLKGVWNITIGEDDDGNDPYHSNCIDDTQADNLLNLAERAYSDASKRAELMARLCSKFKIENITQLPLSNYKEACALLNDTIANIRKKAAEAKEAAQ